ncbi:sensor histidine kinase [Leptospira ilyithenensis]|uniref:histidine kinase n=1 Tax=Leptospira ilyithenensis TaxID=2484901 RepID=A0A4R9LXQ2_9LEPT|nr:HAMP domain-containing sensor histidine kinase [Leptospira ilyithenensis]TGN14531.1 PAS domain S-box protein [Leptospira ilyithenensis]
MNLSPGLTDLLSFQVDSALELDGEGILLENENLPKGKFFDNIKPIPGQPIYLRWEETHKNEFFHHLENLKVKGNLEKWFYFGKASEKEDASFLLSLCRAEGSDRLVLFATTVPLSAFSHVRDKLNLSISDQIQESEEKFRKTFYNSSIGIALVSPNGNWMDVNDAVCSMLGYSGVELRGLTFQDITHPEDLDGDLELVGKTLRGQISSYNLEKRYIHKNGKVVHALLSVSLVRSPLGEPKFFISQLINMTETKELFLALERKNLLLEATSSDLEKKIDQLEEFNRIVAHNLRGSIGNVVSLVALLKEGGPNVDSVEVTGLLDDSSRAVLDNLQTLMKVLEVRANHGVEFEELNFQKTLQPILAILSGNIRNKRAKISYDFKIPSVLYPKVYLESIFYNLLDNALKYTHADKEPQINVSTYMENGRTVLAVQDNGLGIDLKFYGDQIFKYKKIFHRGFESNGVGLFMTKNQIETFGGSIDVKSKVGEGSTFTVTFV